MNQDSAQSKARPYLGPLIAIAVLGVVVVVVLVVTPNRPTKPAPIPKKTPQKKPRHPELTTASVKALGLVSELEKEIVRWEREVLPLETNERGKFLTAKKSDAFDYDVSIQVFAKWRATPSPESLRKRAEAVKQAAEEESPTLVEDDLYDELHAVERDVLTELEQFRSNREAIESHLAAARKAGTKGELTIRELLQATKGRPKAQR